MVNNADIAGPAKPIEEFTWEEWDRTQAVNVTGMFLMSKHAVPHLRESDRGRIVNVSSISGKRPLRNRTPYAASKMAVIGFTRTLAVELGDDGITAEAVCPGATKGPRIEEVIETQAESLGVDFEEAKRQVFHRRRRARQAHRGPGRRGEVASLASDRGDHLTARDINGDAGAVRY